MIRPDKKSRAPGIDDNVMLAIGLKVVSVTLFAVMAAMIKAAEGVPIGERMFFRAFLAIVPIVILLQYRGELATSLHTKRFGNHLTRGILGTMAMGMVFVALAKLPLPEATTLHYATPLIIVIFSAILLKEQVRMFRWSAVVVGLIGVSIVAWPRLSLFSSGADFSADIAIGVGAALVGAVLAAAATLTMRSLVTTERSPTIVLYLSMTTSVLCMVTVPFGWIMPSPMDWVVLIGAGIAGGVGQITLTESYRHADMSIIAPFEYASLLLSIILGYFIFGDIPTKYTLVGGAIVVAAGIFIILREHRLGLERAQARKVSPPQG